MAPKLPNPIFFNNCDAVSHGCLVGCCIGTIANTWVVLANLTCDSILKLVQGLRANCWGRRVPSRPRLA